MFARTLSEAASRCWARRGALRPWAAPVVVGLVALGICGYDLALPRALHGITQYDDGAYFGAAERLTAGVLPYRDYTFVQPPGIAVLLAPFALATHAAGTRVGLALARVLTGLVAAGDSFLAAALLRRRGLAASLAAGLALALDPAAFFADRTLLLEPYLMLFCLLAMAAAFSGGRLAGNRRLLLAGALLGVAGAVKTWAVLPFLALLAVATLPAAGRARRLGALAAGCAGAFLSLCFPFFVAAPGAFVHEVLVTQLGRSAGRRFLLTRIEVLVGVHGLSWLRPGAALTAAVAVALLAVLAGGSLLPALRRRGDPLETFCLLCAAAAVLAVLTSPNFYDHYAYFPATFGALLLGCAAGRAVAAGRRRLLGGAPLAMASPAAVLAIGCLAFGAVFGLGEVALGEASYAAAMTTHAGDPALAIDLAVPAGACAISDAPILLVAANRFASDRRGCPSVVDPEGTLLSLSPGAGGGSTRKSSPAVVRTWEDWLGEATFFVESASAKDRIPWTPALVAFFHRRYEKVPDPGAAVYVRRDSPLAPSLLAPARWTASRLEAEGLRLPAAPPASKSSARAPARADGPS